MGIHDDIEYKVIALVLGGGLSLLLFLDDDDIGILYTMHLFMAVGDNTV